MGFVEALYSVQHVQESRIPTEYIDSAYYICRYKPHPGSRGHG